VWFVLSSCSFVVLNFCQLNGPYHEITLTGITKIHEGAFDESSRLLPKLDHAREAFLMQRHEPKLFVKTPGFRILQVDGHIDPAHRFFPQLLFELFQ